MNRVSGLQRRKEVSSKACGNPALPSRGHRSPWGWAKSRLDWGRKEGQTGMGGQGCPDSDFYPLKAQNCSPRRPWTSRLCPCTGCSLYPSHTSSPGKPFTSPQIQLNRSLPQGNPSDPHPLQRTTHCVPQCSVHPSQMDFSRRYGKGLLTCKNKFPARPVWVSPLYRWGKWGPESWTNLPRAVHPESEAKSGPY